MKKSTKSDQGKDKDCPLIPDEFYQFNELKCGDHFAWEGTEYEKISPDQAIKTHNNSVVEFEKGIKVYYFDPFN